MRRRLYFAAVSAAYVGMCFAVAVIINMAGAWAQQQPGTKRECQTLESCYEVIAELEDKLTVETQRTIQLDRELKSAHQQLTGMIQQQALIVRSPEQERLNKRAEERKKAEIAKKAAAAKPEPAKQEAKK